MNKNEQQQQLASHKKEWVIVLLATDGSGLHPMRDGHGAICGCPQASLWLVVHTLCKYGMAAVLTPVRHFGLQYMACCLSRKDYSLPCAGSTAEQPLQHAWELASRSLIDCVLIGFLFA